MKASEGCGLKVLDMEVMRGHYAETLRHWRLRFQQHDERMTEIHDARFVRMWNFYLLGCEYFFRCQHGMVVQLQLSDTHNAVPKSRSFISNLENDFRNRLCRNVPSGKTSHSAT